MTGMTLTCSVAAADMAKEIWAKENGERLLHDNGNSMILDSGGPDDFGYFFIDSADSAFNAPVFRWVDIRDTATIIDLEQDDQILGPFNVGFSFFYYNQFYTQVYICSNGWISFGYAAPEYLNRGIPSANEPNNLLAAFWDDLTPDGGNAYFYTNGNDSCVIAWHQFGHYTGEGLYTFEIILTRDGEIHFQYLGVSGVLDSHTIGIENRTGTFGLEYVHNSQSNESGKSIYIGRRPPRYADHDVLPLYFASPVGRSVVGDSIRPVVRFYNSGNFNENFNVRVLISNGPIIYNRSLIVTNLLPDTFTVLIFPWYRFTQSGTFELRAITELATDLVPTNDTISISYPVFSEIVNINFEANNGSFVGNNDWQWGHPTRGPSGAHSGQNVWGTILDSLYSEGPLLSTLISDTLLLDSLATVSFWHWYETEALFDGGNVKISADDGITWTILSPNNGYDGVLSDVFFNPIGGEPAYYGASTGWEFEMFDLSLHADQVVILKFDFGSDVSSTAYGWYIDDFSILGGQMAGTGWMTGTVRDLGNSDPIVNAVVQTSRRTDTTGFNGQYILELLPGSNSISAGASYHNTIMVDSVVIIEGDTTNLDIYLPAPAIILDTTPMDTFVVQGRQATFTRQIGNTGNGPLEFDVSVEYLPMASVSHDSRKGQERLDGGSEKGYFETLDFGDEVFTFDPQGPTGDQTCVGVEFDGDNFWVTGRHSADDVHKLHKFDRNGGFLESFDQNTISAWGWRDLAWDGSYLYASDENELAKIDVTTGEKVDTLPMPSGISPPVRALAYDRATDHFWGANFASNIIEFDRSGTTISSFSNALHIYGLAWDNVSPDGPWLWVFSQDGEPLTRVSQFDPDDGVYTGVSFQAIDHNGGQPDIAGGACLSAEWDSSMGILFCFVIGRAGQFDSFDLVQGYEITPFSRWLSISPLRGVVPPLQTVDLNITVDFTDTSFVPEQSLRAVLTINNNGIEQPSLQLNVGVRSGVEEPGPDLPREFRLYQNYPNPFNDQTLISFDLPQKSDVGLRIFDIQGRQVACLAEKQLDAGKHSFKWDAYNLSSGMYFYRLDASGFSSVGKMTLLK
jgi:hypothetical protein